MKEEILRIIHKELSYAKDNLNRATVSFKGFSPSEMIKEHGKSGHCRLEILKNYQNRVLKLEKCLRWVERASK